MLFLLPVLFILTPSLGTQPPAITTTIHRVHQRPEAVDGNLPPSPPTTASHIRTGLRIQSLVGMCDSRHGTNADGSVLEDMRGVCDDQLHCQFSVDASHLQGCNVNITYIGCHNEDISIIFTPQVLVLDWCSHCSPGYFGPNCTDGRVSACLPTPLPTSPHA